MTYEKRGSSGGTGISSVPETRFFSGLPSGNKGIDFAGFQIDRFTLRIDALEEWGVFTFPYFWDFSAVSATLSVYGEPDAQVPVLIRSPQTQTVEAGSTPRLKVRADGTPPMSYRWFLDSTNALTGLTNWFLDLTNVQASQSGAYSVVVSNRFGATTSAVAALNVIAPVPRRTIPAIHFTGEVDSLLHLNYADTPDLKGVWQALDAVILTNTSQPYVNLSTPLAAARFYRAWQTNGTSMKPSLRMSLATEIPLTGTIGSKLRIDYINAVGPIDAWATLDTVTLTNTTQQYFDFGISRQTARLYRVIPVP
jgi:hypothetical protein